MKEKNKKEIKVETGIPSENSVGKCRVDSAEGCKRYFEERFKKFKTFQEKDNGYL